MSSSPLIPVPSKGAQPMSAYGGYRTYVGYNTDDTRCGACLEPVIHGPEQCIVMQMYVSAAADEEA
jgi:hypothetical protein